MEEKVASIKLFRLKMIIAIVISFIIIDWYCDAKDINIVFSISTEDKNDASDSNIHIKNFKFRLGN